MYRILSFGALLIGCGSLLHVTGAVAQQTQPDRQLAPGVLTVIPTDALSQETFSGPVPLVEVVTGMPQLEWTFNFLPDSETLLEKAKLVTFRRSIWNLEFAFKPLRMIEVDVPQPSGKMQRKLIWYMVYRVKYLGYDQNPSAKEDRWGHITFPTTEAVNYPSQRFFPHFVLESPEYNKAYLDRVIPAAKLPIQLREKPAGKLHNSVEITAVPVPLSDERTERSVWGVVTWEDVDPRIDYCSIYVQGLTNAFRFEDPPGAFKAGDPPGTGRKFMLKTLKLNFWRPGDSVFEHEREIHFGVPVDPDPVRQQDILDLYGQAERLDHMWVYR